MTRWTNLVAAAETLIYRRASLFSTYLHFPAQLKLYRGILMPHQLNSLIRHYRDIMALHSSSSNEDKEYFFPSFAGGGGDGASSFSFGIVFCLTKAKSIVPSRSSWKMLRATPRRYNLLIQINVYCIFLCLQLLRAVGSRKVQSGAIGVDKYGRGRKKPCTNSTRLARRTADRPTVRPAIRPA